MRHEGATWLDRTMIGGGRETMPHTGFGGDVRVAWEARKRALADMGYAEDRGQGQFRSPSDMIARLERADISRVGKALAAERGLTWQPSAPSEYVSGKLVGSTQIASGRFAMIECFTGSGGLGFQLVPWSDPLEKRLGRQHISGVAMSSGGVDWSFGRSRGLGL